MGALTDAVRASQRGREYTEDPPQRGGRPAGMNSPRQPHPARTLDLYADSYTPKDKRANIGGPIFQAPPLDNPYGPYDAPEMSVFNRRPPGDELARDASGYVGTPAYLDNPFGLSTTLLGGYKGSGPTGTGDLFAGNESNYVGAIGVRNFLLGQVLERLGKPRAFNTGDKLEASGNALESQLGLSGRDIASDTYSRSALQDVVNKNTMADLLIKLYGQGADIFSTSQGLTASARNRGNAAQQKKVDETRATANDIVGGLSAFL